jgi:hypothetical protein
MAQVFVLFAILYIFIFLMYAALVFAIIEKKFLYVFYGFVLLLVCTTIIVSVFKS